MATSPGRTSSRLFPLFLLAILALFFLLQTASAASSTSFTTTASSRNVYDTIRKDGRFKTLFGEIHSDFAKIVSGQDITAFAVVDSAWATEAFAEDEVGYFFVDGKIDLSLTNETILSTYLTLASLGNASQQLRITKNETGIFVNDAIVNSVISATNGNIYVFEKFIYPPKKISQVLVDQSDTSIFAALIEAGQFSQEISPVTGFVPSNSAFIPTNRIIAYYLMRPEARRDLIQVISTHFVPGLIYSTSFNNDYLEYPTMNNESAISISPDKITLGGNSFGIVQNDILAEDGVIQTIDGLMIPSNVQFNLRKLLLGLNATSFLYAVNVTGLDYLISDSSNVTVFVPENDKFDALVNQISLDMLKKIVLYHFVNTSVTSDQIGLSTTLATLQSDTIRISKDSDGNMNINNIYVTYSDITVPNVRGVIYSIAGVLTPPPSISTVLSQISNSSIFWDLWKIANISNEEILTLSDQIGPIWIDKNNTSGSVSDSKKQKKNKDRRRSTLRKRDLMSSLPDSDSVVISANTIQTVLAPQNSAFKSLPSELMNFLTSSSFDARATLRKILFNHIIPDATLSYPYDFVPGGRYTNLIGNNISFSLSTEVNGTILINSLAQITESNYIAKNGIVHLIDTVLLPDLNFNLIHVLTGAKLTSFVAQIEKNPTLYAKLSSDSSLEKYTVFAPTNEAMESADLTNFDPSYYIVENTIPSSDFEDHQLLDSLYRPESLNGESQKLQILINNNSTTINGVTINSADLNASNGVVHITNGVIPVPKTFTEIIFDPSSGFTKFAQLLEAYDDNKGSLLTQSLKDTQRLTMFIPTDAAFEKMGSTLFSYLISKNDLSEADLSNLIHFHANKADDDDADILYAKNIPNGVDVAVNTLNKRDIVIHNSLDVNSTEYSGYHLTINTNISVVNPDILMAEGVIHAIDTVIIPKELLDMTSLRAMIGLGDTSVVSLLQKASMDNKFDGSESNPYTIFAPTNDAFARLEAASHVNSMELKSILELHILEGSFYTINEGDIYDPIIHKGYLLLGGAGGNSIICINMTYYNSQQQENDRINAQDLVKRTNRVRLLREIRKMDVLTPGSAYRANILRKEVTSNGVIYEIDAVLGLHGSATNAGKWIILGLVVATLAVVLAVGLWLYRKHQQQVVEATSPVRLLD